MSEEFLGYHVFPFIALDITLQLLSLNVIISSKGPWALYPLSLGKA